MVVEAMIAMASARGSRAGDRHGQTIMSMPPYALSWINAVAIRLGHFSNGGQKTA
jgi:hypothetical protein